LLDVSLAIAILVPPKVNGGHGYINPRTETPNRRRKAELPAFGQRPICGCSLAALPELLQISAYSHVFAGPTVHIGSFEPGHDNYEG
jgi:hypothetical protein